MAAAATVMILASAALTAEPSIITSDRLIHRFDFDERKTGNLENLPRYWEVFRPADFPRFPAAQCGFDFTVGRGDEASFRLTSAGRNIAYHYNGPETPVQIGTSYSIEGYVQGSALVNARARLSAVYLDEHGDPILEGMQSSALIGDLPTTKWARVILTLPPAPKRAKTIGLVAWVLQERAWNNAPRAQRHIEAIDVAAVAWFDDIVIHALPRIEIRSTSPGNVLPPDGNQAIEVALSDHIDDTLVGELVIETLDGRALKRATIPVILGGATEPHRVPVSDLPADVYRARLTVLSRGDAVASRTLRFAVLPPARRKNASLARPFGIVVASDARASSTAEQLLLHEQLARSAKLPVWGAIGDAPPVDDEHAYGAMLRALLKDGFSLTGVFAGPPPRLAAASGPYDRSLIEILAENPDAWRVDLADVLAPYAGFFRWWQVGADGEQFVGDEEQLQTALSLLQQEMAVYMSSPILATVASSSVQSTPQPDTTRLVTLAIEPAVAPEWFAEEISAYRRGDGQQTAVYIKSLPVGLYDEAARVTDWAVRVLAARHAGADVVYTPQTWDVRPGSDGPVAEPRQEYLIFRTIADVVGDAEPAGRLPAPEGVEALVFHHADSSVIALRAPHAPPEGVEVILQLGAAREAINLLGHTIPLQKDAEGRHRLTVHRMPLLVDGVEKWLTELAMSIAIAPARLEFGARDHTHELTFRNPYGRHMSGAVRLTAPEGWSVSPATLNLSLGPGASQTSRIELTYPHTEPAGDKQLTVSIDLIPSGYRLDVPLTVSLGLSEIEAWAMPIIEGDDLVLRHVVTNRSNEVLHFRGAAVVPGSSRQYQPFYNLKPGDTTMAEYRFTGGAALAGRTVRLMLRELNDGSRVHNLAVVVP
jgi:hypothetical protein